MTEGELTNPQMLMQNLKPLQSSFLNSTVNVLTFSVLKYKNLKLKQKRLNTLIILKLFYNTFGSHNIGKT